MATAQSPAYTEISAARVSRGNNVNVATIPANRCVASAGTQSNPDAIDLIVSGNVAKFKGVTAHTIAPGDTGDVHDEGVVPVESDGSAIINPGVALTANTTAGATQGRVLPAAPGAGVNSVIVGYAETYAPATAGAIVMMRVNRSMLQG